ncbi:CHAT domain-containing protein [Streptomyces sp. NPDC023998]|uniref:CHAT domain-containing protein n=1 Tax=Streptomyces sp. NPDC023998 TaxID=3154597 RepID=UPI0033FB858F
MSTSEGEFVGTPGSGSEEAALAALLAEGLAELKSMNWRVAPDRAVHLLGRVVRSTGPRHPLRLDALSGLARAFQRRAEVRADDDDLEWALIHLRTAAGEATETGSPAVATLRCECAAALLDLFLRRYGDQLPVWRDRLRSQVLQKLATARTCPDPKGYLEAAKRHLGGGLFNLADTAIPEEDPRLSLLNEAAYCLALDEPDAGEACEASPRVLRLSGQVLRLRGIARGSYEEVERGVRVLRHLCALPTGEQPGDSARLLSSSLEEAWLLSADQGLLAESLTWRRCAARDAPSGSALEAKRQLAVALCLAETVGLEVNGMEIDGLLEEASPAVSPTIRMEGWNPHEEMRDAKFCTVRGSRALRLGRWAEAEKAYVLGAEAIECALWCSPHPAAKDEALRLRGQMAPDLAYARYQNGAGALPLAVALELARYRLTSESLGPVLADELHRLEKLDPEAARRFGIHADRYRRIEKFVRSGHSNAALGTDPRRLWSDLIAHLDSIRGIVPGAAHFALPAFPWPDSLECLEEAAGQWIHQCVDGTSLVYLVCATPGSFAVAIPAGRADKARIVELPELSLGSVDSWVHGFWEALRTEARGWRTAFGTSEERVDACASKLYTIAMGPILTSLAESTDCRRIALVPCGLTAQLPLHAAWDSVSDESDERRFVIEDWALTYAPCANALAAAQRAARRTRVETVAIITDPARARCREPNDVVPASSDGPLREIPGQAPSTHHELQAIRTAFSRATVLSGDGATRSAGLDVLSTHSVTHLDCHGSRGDGTVYSMGLQLAHGVPLEAHEILGRRLTSSRLVFLSACDSATFARSLPDELLGLPSVLLQAGAAGVIGSLWPVKISAAAFLSGYFYRALAEQDAPHDPVAAFHTSVNHLRKATFAELRRDHPELAQSVGLPPDAISWKQPFAEPHMWAAFIYQGW